MDRAVPYGAIDGQLDAAPVMSRHKAVRDSYHACAIIHDNNRLRSGLHGCKIAFQTSEGAPRSLNLALVFYVRWKTQHVRMNDPSDLAGPRPTRLAAAYPAIML